MSKTIKKLFFTAIFGLLLLPAISFADTFYRASGFGDSVANGCYSLGDPYDGYVTYRNGGASSLVRLYYDAFNHNGAPSPSSIIKINAGNGIRYYAPTSNLDNALWVIGGGVAPAGVTVADLTCDPNPPPPPPPPPPSGLRFVGTDSTDTFGSDMTASVGTTVGSVWEVAMVVMGTILSFIILVYVRDEIIYRSLMRRADKASAETRRLTKR